MSYRKLAFLSSLCLVFALVAPAQQPAKRVMSYLAVMDLNCGTALNKENCTMLTNIVIEELVQIGKSTGKFTVIDRANRDKILGEQGFQQKGCVEDSCTVDMGRILGVGRIVVGSISKMGETYVVSLQIVNVETAAVDTAQSEICECKLEGLIGTIRNVSRKLMGQAPEAPPSVAPPVGPSGPQATSTAKGTVVVSTTPPGADIFLDSAPMGKTPKTLIDIPVGTHQLTLVLEGYTTLNKGIDVRVGQNAPVNEILMRQAGSIELTSVPTGADVWIDGKYLGKSPQKLLGVSIGKHTVKMSLQNYVDYSGQLNVEANTTATVSTKLQGLPGKVLVTSTPSGADVYIDGKKVGATTYNGEIAPGSYTVKISKPEYQSAEETVTIEPNKPKNLDVILKKGPDVRGDMVYVSSGDFLMGSTPQQAEDGFKLCENYYLHVRNAPCKRESYRKEEPQHKVYLNAFYLDKFEVTVQQYQACIQAGRCKAAHFDDGRCSVDSGGSWNKGKLPQSFLGGNQPVVCIDWNQSKAYCEWVGKRLPTEAEWEKGARGTEARTYPWGDQNPSCQYAVTVPSRLSIKRGCGNDSTMPVGSKPKGSSPYGAMDMAGNASEWVADLYGGFYYENSPDRNPTGPASGTHRVTRGGDWSSMPFELRTTGRSGARPEDAYDYLGFRCVRDP